MSEYGADAMDLTPEQALAHYESMMKRKRRDDMTDYVLSRNATAAGLGSKETDKQTMKAFE
jgi:hypothetical protein